MKERRGRGREEGEKGRWRMMWEVEERRWRRKRMEEKMGRIGGGILGRQSVEAICRG